jgi:iron(II)-dependent oxidoreductase
MPRSIRWSLCYCLLGTAAAAVWAVNRSATMAQGAEKPGDDAEMVLVPAGAFTMGSSGKALDEDPGEKPVHKVSLPAFFIDKYEVTNAQYARFLNVVKQLGDGAGHRFCGADRYLQIDQIGGMWQPKKGMEKFPMGNVSWYGASAYACWAGKRLPSEAEWEKAARGTDGRKFPWGNTMDFAKFRLGIDHLSPVGTLPAGASPYGCLNMADNVWEWTRSLYKPYPYDPADGREDPQAPGRRVARGGSWSGEPFIAHAAYRFHPDPTFAHYYLGFRCAKSAF